MLDTRHYVSKILNHRFKISVKSSVIKFIISFLVSYSIAFIPVYAGLNEQSTYMLFIIAFSASLWMSEAVPAFAVSFLIIALEIMFLGFHDFDFGSGSKEWMYFLKPWSSPLVFLFVAGFILAIAASKTKLDLWLAKKILFYFGNKPKNVLSGLMLITFVLSMFISNTATTAMMMTMLIPILKNMKKDNPFQKAILLAIVVSANIGGMGTIIGTPPNAIAVGILGDNAPSFVSWMFLALPPAILIVLILRFVILKAYPSNEDIIDISQMKKVQHYDDSTTDFTPIPTVPSWKKILVIVIFVMTILLWLTGPFHHIPTPVVSLLPVVIFSLFGVIDTEDVREIRWDVIILIIGGLALGSGVAKTGLDSWLGAQFSLDGLSVYVIVAIFAAIVVLVSNFMSNTAATNIMLPLVVALVGSLGDSVVSFIVISVALCASCAMMLPVSTPPNAIAFSSGQLFSKDFLLIGVVSAIVGPVMILGILSLH